MNRLYYMNRKKVGLVIVLIGLVIAVVSYFVLPEIVVIQKGFDGNPTNAIPKLSAVLLPFVLSGAGAFLFAFSNPHDKSKYLGVSIFGYLTALLIYLFNR